MNVIHQPEDQENPASSSDANLNDETPLGRAQARLAASRARLRRQFIPPPPSPPGRPGQGFAARWLHTLASGPLQTLRKWIGRNPITEAALSGVNHWWDNHPLRNTAELAGSEIAGQWRRSGVPLLRRHPLASVAIAGLAGAAFVTARPWRSANLQSLSHLSRRMGRWLMAQVPLKTVLSSLVVMLAARGTVDVPPDHATSDTANRSRK